MRRKASLIIVVSTILRLATTATADVVNVGLNIQNTQLEPNGVSRSAVTANGQYPGPLISGNIGDQFLIIVVDNLTDPTMRRATSIVSSIQLETSGYNSVDAETFRLCSTSMFIVGDWHLEGGLAIVFAEDPEDVAAISSFNADWSNLCPSYNQLNPDTDFA
ncbi:LCC11_6 [Sanghuangporus vaninii]